MIRLFKRSVRNLVRNPIRLALVIVLLGVSLLFVEALLGLNESAQARLDELNNQVGSSIQIARAGTFLSQQQIDLIVHTPGVITYAEEAQAACSSTDAHFKLIPLTGQPGQTSSASSGATTICYGFTPGASAVLRVKSSAPGEITIAEGRMFTASEDRASAHVVVIGSSLAQLNHVHPGASIGLNGKTFTVIGVYSTGSTLDPWIILPVHTMLTAFPTSGVSSLTVYTSGHTNVSALLATLHLELGNGSQASTRRPLSPGISRGEQSGDFQFTTTQGQFDPSLQSLDAIQQTSRLGLSVALAVAMLVIVFTALWLVRERRKEIGVLRAVGASNWQVVSQLSAEMLCFNLLAACLSASLLLPIGSTIASSAVITPPGNQGVAVGNSAAALAAAQPLTIPLTAQSILILVLAALLLAIVASIVPAWYVAHLRPAHALRVK